MPQTADLASAVSKARRRLIPFLFLLYIVAYFDRVNVGFAALQMNEALGLSAQTYALGAGIFFVSYVAFEIPMSFWLPQILKITSGGSDFEVGVLSAIPYLCGAIGMVATGRHSDRTGERRWHVAIAAAVGGAAFAASAFVSTLAPSLVLLSLAMLGLASMFGPFWTLATGVVRGVGAAAGIALINSVGNIGGFVGPYLLGYVRDTTGSFAAGLISVGIILPLGGALVLLARD